MKKSDKKLNADANGAGNSPEYRANASRVDLLGDLLTEELGAWKQTEAHSREALHANTHARIRNVIRAEQAEAQEAVPFTSGLRTLWVRVAYMAGIPALGLLLVMAILVPGESNRWSSSVPQVEISKDGGEIVFQSAQSVKIYKSMTVNDFSAGQELEGGAGQFRDTVEASENLVFYRIE